jgi:excinuclease UvrABC ATPase subunit
MFIRNFLPKYPPPAADAIEHLNMAVVVDQNRLGGGSHSTVGTVTDIYTVLRLLFSRAGKPHAGYANVFSFNDPQGMCPECSGLGRKLGVKADSFLDKSKSLAEGAVQVPVFAAWENNVYAACGFFDVKKKLSKFTKEEMDLLLHGTERKFKTTYNGQPFNARYEGIIAKFTRAYIKRDLKARPERTQKLVEPFLTMGPCSQCHGARLPSIAGPHGWSDLPSLAEGLERRWVLDPGGPPGLGVDRETGNAALLVGPEGGLTQGELATARELDFRPVALGPRILRIETAAVAGASLALLGTAAPGRE